MTNEKKQHKKCIQDTINQTKRTHSCFKEHPINRNGDFHFIDVVGFPHDTTNFKPFACECENESSNLQRQSNLEDLREWKKHYPESEVFQVEDAEEIDFEKLKKKPKFRYGGGLR